jgi:hypothetical protein
MTEEPKTTDRPAGGPEGRPGAAGLPGDRILFGKAVRLEAGSDLRLLSEEEVLAIIEEPGKTNAAAAAQPPEPTDDRAQQELFRGIDAIIARLDTGIAKENAALDALLDRLTQRAA